MFKNGKNSVIYQAKPAQQKQTRLSVKDTVGKMNKITNIHNEVIYLYPQAMFYLVILTGWLRNID